MVDNALEPFELLESGKTDVIFAAGQGGDVHDWTPLYDDIMYAVLPADYPLTDGEHFSVGEFSGKEFIMPYGRFDIEVNKIFSANGIRANIKPAHVDDETVIRMVGKGLGVSMMSEMMIRGRTDDVKVLPISPSAGRKLGMGMNGGGGAVDGIGRLKECVLAFLGKESR